jgi:hypothetical protein
MEDIDFLIQNIRVKVTEKFREQKTALFLSNGKMFGRDWKDLSDNYKLWKDKTIGHIYPIYVLYGDMLEALLKKSLRIEFNHFSDHANVHVSIDSERMDIEYAEKLNIEREFIKFSDEEKEELVEITKKTIEEFLGT